MQDIFNNINQDFTKLMASGQKVIDNYHQSNKIVDDINLTAKGVK